MSNHMKVAKVTKAMVSFEKTINFINDKIDRRTQSGKINEDDSNVDNHLNVNSDGSRCWSF